jgi:dTDP-4-amino-4,6-dideoxygalactose transaminase
MQNFIPFSVPEIGEEEIAEVVDTLRSGWVTTGPKAKQFEEDFTLFLGGEVESISVNSSTSGLHLALEAIGVGPDDEVIVPSYTFTATAEVVRYLGATPIFVDVLESTFNISPQAIEDAITAKTKAIIPVHFAGLSCDMKSILNIAHKHGLKVVEDAAHALPTTFNGDIIGSLESDVTVFSFYANKTMTTGEGGMLVTRDPSIAARCKVMRLHGISKDAFDRYSSTTPAWYYEVVAPGYKYNMPDISASIGIHQLKKLKGFQKKRAALADRYNESLNCLPIILPPRPTKGDLHAWHLYPIRLEDSNVSRDEFIKLMASKYSIGCSVHFIPLHLQPYWKKAYNLNINDFPVSQKIYEHEISIPLYSKMTISEQDRVISAIREILIDYG